jgi:cytochrome c-type protein NapB
LVGFGLLLAGSATVAVVALGTAITRALEQPAVLSWETQSALGSAEPPIRAEAEVFRTSFAVVAIPPEGARERDAHPRTLARYRFVRAYPGAPPRIPHGFTADEFRTGACNTCHRRGGYSPRFNAYVPVTPHPDMPACLQCHVGRDEVTGVSLPELDPSAVCRQCHLPGAAAWGGEALVNWQPMAWPALWSGGDSGAPAPITHDLFFRENCLSCHSGPSAVREIRTSHPDWANCRQCHAASDPTVSEFVRPIGGAR